MKYCVGKMKCQFLGLKLDGGFECLKKNLDCEHQRIPIFPEDELLPPSDLTRIADALEKIARELEKQNKLKAATLLYAWPSYFFKAQTFESPPRPRP